MSSTLFFGPGKSAKNLVKRPLRNVELNPVLGENLEDLHRRANHELLDSVLGGNLEDRQELECLRTARRKPATWDHVWPAASLNRASIVIPCGNQGTVGTSTNCSTSCGSRSGVRGGMLSSRMILGQAETCQRIGDRPPTGPPSASTRASRATTSSYQMPACRSTFPCCLPSARGAGRTPAASSPPSSSVSG